MAWQQWMDGWTSYMHVARICGILSHPKYIVIPSRHPSLCRAGLLSPAKILWKSRKTNSSINSSHLSVVTDCLHAMPCHTHVWIRCDEQQQPCHSLPGPLQHTPLTHILNKQTMICKWISHCHATEHFRFVCELVRRYSICLQFSSHCAKCFRLRRKQIACNKWRFAIEAVRLRIVLAVVAAYGS